MVDLFSELLDPHLLVEYGFMLILGTYILKAGDPGDRTPPIFFIFRQNLGWERENLQDCTALMPLHLFVILCLVFVFNINTSDLLYFDIMLFKTPDLCNLRTFVAIFFLSRFTHFFRQFLEAKKQTPPIYPLLECMSSTWQQHDQCNSEHSDITHLTSLDILSLFLIPFQKIALFCESSIEGFPIIFMDRSQGQILF
mgnify:CR=1 FL=1